MICFRFFFAKVKNKTNTIIEIGLAGNSRVLEQRAMLLYYLRQMEFCCCRLLHPSYVLFCSHFHTHTGFLVSVNPRLRIFTAGKASQCLYFYHMHTRVWLLFYRNPVVCAPRTWISAFRWKVFSAPSSFKFHGEKLRIR